MSLLVSSQIPPAVDLNPEQRAAVTAPEGCMLVDAGPGSGKTRVLTERVRELLRRGVPPARLCVFTFTRRAAEELQHRLGPTAAGMWVSTFHSAALRILRETPGLVVPVLLGEHDSRGLVVDAAAVCGVDAAPRELAECVSYAVNMLDDTRVRPGRSVGVKPEELGRVLEEYRGLLDAAGATDFDGLLLAATAALRDHREVWEARFDHVLIDEYQDVSPAQVALVTQLGGWVTAVGDMRQAIYGFRGADVSIIDSFTDTYPGAVVYRLNRNYRSTVQVCSLANRVFPDSPLVSMRGGGPEPVARVFPDRWGLARFLAGEVLPSSPGEGWVVLTRLSRTAEMLEFMLAVCGVNPTVRSSPGFFKNPEVRGLLSGFRSDTAPDVGRLLERYPPWLVRLVGEAVAEVGGDPLCLLDRVNRRRGCLLSVDLSTVHASKGLEYDGVVVDGLESGNFPYVDADVEEERRLFYVAVTRARRRLVLSRSRSKLVWDRDSAQWRSRAVSPSRFLVGLLAPSGL